jgi:hypothetical protein
VSAADLDALDRGVLEVGQVAAEAMARVVALEDEPEFLRLNREVAEAERGVSWWRRWLISRRILRELDYWNRMRRPS